MKELGFEWRGEKQHLKDAAVLPAEPPQPNLEEPGFAKPTEGFNTPHRAGGGWRAATFLCDWEKKGLSSPLTLILFINRGGIKPEVSPVVIFVAPPLLTVMRLMVETDAKKSRDVHSTHSSISPMFFFLHLPLLPTTETSFLPACAP